MNSQVLAPTFIVLMGIRYAFRLRHERDLTMSERILTSNEIALAKKVFKNSINYKEVKIHDNKYIVFQPNNSGMTPNGEIYVSGVYKKDYSSQSASMQAFFIHEMVHVWQYQLKILSPVTAAITESIKHFFDYSKAYEYTLDGTKDLLDYNIEQQASIVEDYFRISIAGISLNPGRLQNDEGSIKNKAKYMLVLAKFLANPKYATHTIVCKTNKFGHPSQRRTICNRVLIK